MMPPDPYEVLGLAPSASEEEIRAAWRRLARAYHPDLNPAPDAHARLVQINQAYEVLGDPERRRLHDLRSALSAPTFAPPPPPVYEPPPRPSEAELYRPFRPLVYAAVLASWLLAAFMLLDLAASRQGQASEVLKIEGPSRRGYYTVQLGQESFPLYWTRRDEVAAGDRLILRRSWLAGRLRGVYRCRLSSRAPCELYEPLPGIRSLHFGWLACFWGGAALCGLMALLSRRQPETQFRWALLGLLLMAGELLALFQIR